MGTENAPQVTTSTKPRENLGEGCVAAQISPGALVVQGAFKFQGTFVIYRVGGRCSVGWVGRGLLKWQVQTAHGESKRPIVPK